VQENIDPISVVIANGAKQSAVKNEIAASLRSSQ